MNRIPFSDMKSLCDPSTADITGRMLEAFGLLAFCAQKDFVSLLLLGRLQVACDKAVGFLVANQEHNGSCYSRWGVHYVYGTSNVLCGLAYHRNDPRVKSMVFSAVLWLRKVQNVDGGWGEGVDTYQFPERAGRGHSTASQTAWGLIGLMAGEGVDSGDEALRTRDLITRCFSNTGLLFPYLHEQTFLETYAQMRKDNFTRVQRTWLGLLNMVLGFASSTTEEIDLPAKKRATDSDVYYQRALLLCEKQLMRGTSLELGMLSCITDWLLYLLPFLKEHF